jgi:ATP-dependent Clp protease ATP-binding subunit ClpC
MPQTPKDDKPPTLPQLLDFGAKDLTQRALSGQLKRAYGRDAEVARVFAALERNRSVLLLGAAEVGKTAILHEATQRMARRQCPDAVAGKWVVAVSTGDVLTGTHYLGEWQTRLTELLDLVKQGKTVLLSFEDIWALRDAGRASDKAEGFATLIRPYLERGDIQLLGESTPDNFNAGTYGARALADDHSLMKSFEIVQIEEPTPDVTKSILTQVAKGLRQGGVVRIETSGVERAIELTRRFLPYQAFPGKAIRLLTEAKQSAEQAGALPSGAERMVTADEVTASFSRLHGLPEKILSDRTPLPQEEIRAYFGERVIGQDEAVNAVADIVTLIKAEMNDPTRPLGILFFVGPTGVGKTELAKTLAEYLFGSKDRLIRLDMSEYKSPFSGTDLLAQLTEKQRRQTFSVLLLDEIEKASPVVFDLFLQVFSDGRLTDASGRSVDLRNTIITMTSNLGNVEVEELPSRGGVIGFAVGGTPEEPPLPTDPAEIRARLMRKAVEDYFRPEFINRLDKIVVFQPLGRDELRRIARRELGKALVLEGIVRRNILIDFRDEVLDALLAVGYSPRYGARPLQRAIREHVLLPLARTIAANPAIGEQLLELVARDGKIQAEAIPLTAPEQEAIEAEGPRERVPVVEAASASRPSRSSASGSSGIWPENATRRCARHSRRCWRRWAAPASGMTRSVRAACSPRSTTSTG